MKLIYRQQAHTKISHFFIFLIILLASHVYAAAGNITGTVLDAQTHEPLIGATILIERTDLATIADVDGTFIIEDVPPGKYRLRIQYVGYQTLLMDTEVTTDKIVNLNIALTEESQQLEALVIVSKSQKISELSMISATRQSMVVQNGISAQQIKMNQDKDASEVLKRVPGITIHQNKFIVIRGLSQRYNNVWVNNASVPSSEADTRAFSFDLIPSGQLDNIMIIKSPAPEYPADFTGGFILIQTKDIPLRNSFTVGFSANYNDQTHHRTFLSNPGSNTDFLGFDNTKRPLGRAFSASLNNESASQVNNFSQNGFNRDWSVKKLNPMMDYGLESSFSRLIPGKGASQWGILLALNYSHKYTSIQNVKNNSFSIYDRVHDQSVYVDKYIDNQYSINDRVGGILNVTFSSGKKSEFSFKSIINQLGSNRYTTREGYHFESGFYIQKQAEYYYNSRLAYTGQLNGKFKLNSAKLDWGLGYSYSNNLRPDRRKINLQENDNPLDPHFGQLQLDQNDISREFSTLHENSYSLSSNFEKNLKIGSLTTTFKSGIYGEYRKRNYDNRQFFYRWNNQNLPENISYLDPINDILIPSNYGADKLYLFEELDRRNSYQADNKLYAGYVAFNIPIGRLNIYTGARYENNLMTLYTFTDLQGLRTKDYEITDGKYGRIYPSLNVTYKFSDKRQLRLAYGESINRQEFREVAPYVYHDFDLFSDVIGNSQLKPAHISNAELRYELYPAQEEMISLAVFYKYFRNPIEWSYRAAGSGKTYFFENAKNASNYGAELEIKKKLDFIGLSDFAWNFNGVLIKSKVSFDANSLEVDRPMQGQSNYIINTGILYHNRAISLTAAVLYNRIGKRIAEVGRTDKSEGGSINNSLPDTYEMPRNIIDISLNKEINEHWEIRLAVRDLLASKVVFSQFPQFENEAGQIEKRTQVIREYQPGRNYSVGLNFKF